MARPATRAASVMDWLRRKAQGTSPQAYPDQQAAEEAVRDQQQAATVLDWLVKSQTMQAKKPRYRSPYPRREVGHCRRGIEERVILHVFFSCPDGMVKGSIGFMGGGWLGACKHCLPVLAHLQVIWPGLT